MLPRNSFDKIGAIWCILSVPKLVIINLNINICLIINQQPKFCAIFFSTINPDGQFGTKINTFTFYKGDLGGNSPQKAKKCKEKNGGFMFFIPGAKIYPVMMSIQIHARGVQIFFLLKCCNMAHSERPKCVIINLKINNFQANFPQ